MVREYEVIASGGPGQKLHRVKILADDSAHLRDLAKAINVVGYYPQNDIKDSGVVTLSPKELPPKGYIVQIIPEPTLGSNGAPIRVKINSAFGIIRDGSYQVPIAKAASARGGYVPAGIPTSAGPRARIKP